MLSFTLKLLAILSFLATARGTSDACADLKTMLSLSNTTIIAAECIIGGQNISTPGSCQSSAFVSTSLCRVYAVVNTTADSAVHFEMWLPNTWFGRFLALGNGGLEGCIDYSNLDYGSALHFATVASDNGHDGGDGIPFLNHPEVINDFAFRAIHVEAVLGKKIVDAYYKRAHDKSYFLGCSTGGRQGVQSALLYPDDFDGIIAGSPATDFNHLVGWGAMIGRFVRGPIPKSNDIFSRLLQWIGTADRFVGTRTPNESASFIPASIWPTIAQEILNQCDALDGLIDGIITEPDECDFRPEALLCDATNASNCLTALQVTVVRQIYQPLFGTSGQLLYPRYDPGAEEDSNSMLLLSGSTFPIARDWFRFVIFNDSNYSFDKFSVAAIEFADTVNPGGISTWNGNLSSFRDRGGKVISYHGRRDFLIPSGNSKRLYNLISSSLSKRTLDDFYRLFLIPGMGHCAGGPGAWAFGQAGFAATAANDSTHNVLLALVEWVERGNAPSVLIGTTSPGIGGNTTVTERMHCRYPHRSVLDGDAFACQG